jgi:hypothetical protein
MSDEKETSGCLLIISIYNSGGEYVILGHKVHITQVISRKGRFQGKPDSTLLTSTGTLIVIRGYPLSPP